MPIQINDINVIDDSRNFYAAGIATVGSGSSATIINGNTGIVNIGTGVSINGNTGNVSIAGTLIASGFTVPTNIITYSPAIGSTDVSALTDISFTFDQMVGIGTTFGSTGTVELRSGSVDGSIIQSFTVDDVIKNSNFQITLDPTNPLPANTEIFPVIPKGFVKSLQFFEYDGNIIESSINFVGLNTIGAESYSFTTENALTVGSYTPSNGATGIGATTNITLAFNAPPSRGTGTIELRSGSVDGTLVESFDAATSDRISISGNNWILDPTNLLPSILTQYFLIIPSTAIAAYEGLNIGGTTASYSFTTGDLGNPFGGGFLICQSGGTRWVVAPNTSEVSRNWYLRNDANTTAQQVSGCTGWFVPTCGQLQNPGYTCRTYWDSFSSTRYWSSTECSSASAWFVSMSTGSSPFSGKTFTYCVRAFRCVTY